MYALCFLYCLAILIGVAPVAQSAGADSPPDCVSATNMYEAEQCAINVLRTAEDDLQKYLTESKRAWNDLPGVVNALDRAQGKWIEYRKATCEAVRERWTKGTGAGLAGLACEIDLTRRWTHAVWEYFLDGNKESRLPEPKPNQR
jgi:uncharacterized protein YecT (DUF1311 family)